MKTTSQDVARHKCIRQCADLIETHYEYFGQQYRENTGIETFLSGIIWCLTGKTILITIDDDFKQG